MNEEGNNEAAPAKETPSPPVSATRRKERSQLSKLLKEHQTKQTQLRDENEQRRKAAVASVGAARAKVLNAARVFHKSGEIPDRRIHFRQPVKHCAMNSYFWKSIK